MNELYHHGVKGMKWGVRKKYEPVGRKRSGSYSSYKSSGDKTELAHRNHDRIVAKAKQTGKSAAEIEQEEKIEKSNKKLKLTDKQKKAIAIGAIAAGTALTAYGVYKVNSNPEKKFMQNAFRDCGDFSMFSSTYKSIVNDKLTDSSGKWWSGLTTFEKESIEQYSGNDYKLWNDLLWKAKGEDISKFASESTAKGIKAANEALKKASFPESMVCTQGLSMEKACSFLGCSKEELYAAARDSRASKLIGAVNTNHGLFSTTTLSSTSSGFPGEVKYKVLTPKGAHAAFIEHVSRFGDLPHPPMWDGKTTGGPPFSSEFETLFAAGSKFKTKGIRYNNVEDCIEVALEYIFDD